MRRDKVSKSSKRQGRRARLGRVLVVEDDPIVALAIEARCAMSVHPKS
jgi:hypothetical protein